MFGNSFLRSALLILDRFFRNGEAHFTKGKGERQEKIQVQGKNLQAPVYKISPFVYTE